MKIMTWLLIGAFCFAPAALFAQTGEQAELTREVILAEKKLMVSVNMQLTEEEAKGFWPVYEEYQVHLRKFNERTAELILEYAKSYNSMTDDKAQYLLDEYRALKEDILNTQISYLPKFGAVLSPIKTFRYYQIENKLDAVIQFGLANDIPLMR